MPLRRALLAGLLSMTTAGACAPDLACHRLSDTEAIDRTWAHLRSTQTGRTGAAPFGGARLNDLMPAMIQRDDYPFGQDGAIRVRFLDRTTGTPLLFVEIFEDCETAVRQDRGGLPWKPLSVK